MLAINILLGQVNRDPMAAEMQRMRHQVELLQAELLCIREGSSIEEMQVFYSLDGSRQTFRFAWPNIDI